MLSELVRLVVAAVRMVGTEVHFVPAREVVETVGMGETEVVLGPVELRLGSYRQAPGSALTVRWIATISAPGGQG